MQRYSRSNLIGKARRGNTGRRPAWRSYTLSAVFPWAVLVRPLQTISGNSKTAMLHPRRRHHDPLLHAEGMATKAALAAALISLRERCGLTQVQLSRRAGWKPQFVSRLESARGRMPDIATIIRYGKACGTAIGLLFARQGECDLSIVTAVTLQAADERPSFEFLGGRAIVDQSSIMKKPACLSGVLKSDGKNLEPRE
jgi:transcriptional regulator with XRE-family HTH domain